MKSLNPKVLANLLRNELGLDLSSPIDIFSIALSIDKLTLVIYPMGSNISGICYKSNNSNLIAINSNMSIGRQRFSLAHELYHLFYDDSSYTVSPMSTRDNELNEQRANEFALEFLVPTVALIKKVKKLDRPITCDEVIHLEQYFGISHKAMLKMFVELGYLRQTDMDMMLSGVRSKAIRLGYEKTLYEPSSDSDNIKVLGHYIKLVHNLYNNQILSKNEFNNLMLEAFRDDLVIN